MGLFANAAISPMAISQEMRKAVRQFQTAKIVIIDPRITEDLPVIVWSGMACVQPYRKDLSSPQVGNPTVVATVRFQVDFEEDGPLPDIETNFQVYVLPQELSGLDYPDVYISEYAHIVTSAMNSSLAWQRTIETTVNTESRPNYNIVRVGDSYEIR